MKIRRLRLHQYIQGVLSKPDIRSRLVRKLKTKKSKNLQKKKISKSIFSFLLGFSPAMREFLTNDILLSPSAIRELNGEKGKVTIDDFNLLRVIGKGSFGKVMLVQFKKDGRLYAMKVLSKKKVKQHDEVEHIKSGLLFLFDFLLFFFFFFFFFFLFFLILIRFIYTFIERQVLMANTKHPFLVGLRFSFHTSVFFFSKLYLLIS